MCEDIEDRHETCRELDLKLQRKEQIYDKIKEGNLAEAKNLDLSQSGYWGALKGDLVDEMLARYISDQGVKIPISRIGHQLYMFGTRKIYAKIMNNRLVVRVGGGFMGIDQFVQQHTEIEMQRLRRYTPQQLTEMHTPIPEGVPQFTLIGKPKRVAINSDLVKPVPKQKKVDTTTAGPPLTPGNTTLDGVNLAVQKKLLSVEAFRIIPSRQ